MSINVRSPLITLLLGFSYLVGFSQHALISFDPVTMMVETIPAVQYTDTMFASMPHSTGLLPGWVALHQDEPAIPFVGAQNARPALAMDVFDLVQYPIRTAGALTRRTNSVERNSCSANLVGPQHALTARHCVRSLQGVWVTDTMYFAPVFDQGEASQFGRVRINRYIVSTVGQLNGDFALLELESPIGQELGWFGLAFSEEEDYYFDKIVHKLSYPKDTSVIDPSLIYNGDTLYHQYTPMTRLDEISVGVPGTGLAGVPGESGSGVLITDNVQYRITGVAAWATNYRHMVLNAWHYHQFAGILEGFNVGVEERADAEFTALLYPNPMITTAQIIVSNPGEGPFVFTLHDMTGRCIRNITFMGPSLTLDGSGISSGAYVFGISSPDRLYAKGTLVVH